MEEVSQLRVLVPAEGYFQISRKEWEKNGLSIQNPDQLQLLFKGESHPYWFSADLDSKDFAIRFYSPRISPEINLSENVFILSKGSSESNRSIYPLKTPSDQTNFEKNSIGIYREKYGQQSLYLPQVTGEDHWLWSLIQPNQIIEQEIRLPQTVVNGAIIRVQVWITPTYNENPVQFFSASINNHLLDPIRVAGQGWQVLEFHIDSAYLSQENNFSFGSIISPDDLPDKIYLDWIEIEYALEIDLGSTIQSFTSRDDQLLTATSSSKGTLAKVDQNQQLIDIYSILSGYQYTLALKADTTFTWIPEDQFLSVSVIQPIHDENLTIPSQPTDYLVIASKNFHQALSPLIELRQAQGLSTWIVSPQQIYDSYHSGTPSFDSIQKFIQSIDQIEPGQLKYLLLVGDYTYEIVNYQKFLEYVPSIFISTDQSGQTISDYSYADLNGDLIPDLSLGRIPATTSEQLTAWVEKVILYESSIPSDWNQITAISDSSDPNFHEFGRNFVFPMVDDHQTQVLNGPNSDEIQEIFKSSHALVAYFGHGSIDLWGKKKILSVSMLPELPASTAPPVLISFSCLNGYFIHPEKNSLAEGLLFYPGGGVIGTYAPTGQTLMEEHEKLLQFFQNKLQSKGHSRIGSLIFPQEGEKFSINYSDADIQKTYIYFGDPAMIIPQPIHQFSWEGKK
jgi:hypothetical protein